MVFSRVDPSRAFGHESASAPNELRRYGPLEMFSDNAVPFPKAR
jgi:hypothetical protein